MDTKKFEKANELIGKIEQLKNVRTYFEQSVNGRIEILQPTISISVTACARKDSRQLPNEIQEKTLSFIFGAVNEAIDELEKEFNEL